RAPARARSTRPGLPRKFSPARVSSPVVAHDLDVVAVGVEDESAVVAGVIVPLTRRTVVAVARRDERSVKLVHDRVVGGREGEVHVLGQGPVVVDDAEGPILAPEMPPFWPLAREDEAAEGTDGLVEALRGLEVGDPDPEMVDAVVAFARAPVVDCLGSGAVRVEHEAAVVVRRVLRTRSGRPV